MKKVKFVGLDVHKNSIAIAIAGEERDGEVRSYGTIANTPPASIDKFLRKIISDGSGPDFVYEAGPCGYTLYRQLTEKGYRCMVAATSFIHLAVLGNKCRQARKSVWASFPVLPETQP